MRAQPSACGEGTVARPSRRLGRPASRAASGTCFAQWLFWGRADRDPPRPPAPCRGHRRAPPAALPPTSSLVSARAVYRRPRACHVTPADRKRGAVVSNQPPAASAEGEVPLTPLRATSASLEMSHLNDQAMNCFYFLQWLTIPQNRDFNLKRHNKALPCCSRAGEGRGVGGRLRRRQKPRSRLAPDGVAGPGRGAAADAAPGWLRRAHGGPWCGTLGRSPAPTAPRLLTRAVPHSTEVFGSAELLFLGCCWCP